MRKYDDVPVKCLFFFFFKLNEKRMEKPLKSKAMNESAFLATKMLEFNQLRFLPIHIYV